MDFRVFLLFTTIGSLVWTAALGWAGRALGRNFEQVERVIGPISTTVVVGIVVFWIFRVVRVGRNAPG